MIDTFHFRFNIDKGNTRRKWFIQNICNSRAGGALRGREPLYDGVAKRPQWQDKKKSNEMNFVPEI